MMTELDAAREDRRKGKGYLQEVEIVRLAIRQLHEATPAAFPDGEAEQMFFAAVWLRFYGKLFLYNQVLS